MDVPAKDPAGGPVAVDVELDEPIMIGDRELAAIKLRKPNSGELRGLSLVALAQMNVDELIKLLPRITIPHVPAAAIATIAPADMMEIAGKVSDFLLTRRQKAELPTM